MIYGEGSLSAAERVVANVRCIEAAPAWKHLESLHAFWKALTKSAPDVIYARLPSDFLWIAGAFSKLHPYSRFVYALAHDTHCNPWRTYTYNKWFHNPFYALGLHLANVVAVQHEGQAKQVRPYVNGKLVLIPNLIRSIAHQIRTYDETIFDAIWIGKIRTDKQLHVFLDIVEALPDIRFALVGGFDVNMDRRLCDDLERRMLTLKNLSSYGPRRFEEVIQLLVRSKILVNSSMYEGFPNTMLEAWSVGVPVVSLTVDPGEVIKRERIGLVSGTAAGMRDDIKRLVGTRALNCDLGKRGLAYVRKRHSLQAVCRAFEQILPPGRLLCDPIQKGPA